MLSLLHGVASSDVQLCRISFELDFLSRFLALLPAVQSGSAAFSRQSPLIALLEPWDDFDTLKNSVGCVCKVVSKVQLRSRSPPNIHVDWYNVKVFSIPPFGRGQLYVEVPFWWGEIEPSRASAVPTPPMFAYNSPRMLGTTHIDYDVWNLESYGMCALVLCTFWACACLGVVDGFAHDQRVRLYTNRKFDNLCCPPPKVVEFLEQKRSFHLFQRKSFPFVQGYLAAKFSEGFDLWVADGLDGVPDSWKTEGSPFH